MPELLKPPSIPLAILNFFAHQPDFPALAGDMSEEFHQRAQRSGTKTAKRWYWREALRNACALSARELMRTPVRTSIAALACFLKLNLLVDFYAAVKWASFQGSLMDFIFIQSQSSLFHLVNFAVSVAVGWFGARRLPGREWALALTFSLVIGCLALMGGSFALFVLKPDIPTWVRKSLIFANVLRLVGFWLGSLWIRRSRNIKTLATI